MTETWPLRYGLAATVEIGETDRSDVVVKERRGERAAHDPLCACSRCLDHGEKQEARP